MFNLAKVRIVMSSVLLVFALAFASTAAAQTTTFEDADGLFSLSYPSELVVIPDLAAEFGMPLPSVAFTDSQQTSDMSGAAQVLEPGAWGIGVLFIPGGFFEEMGMPAEATLMDRAIAFTSPGPDDAEGTVVAGSTEITLDDGTPAVQIDGQGETEDNLVVFYEVTDDVYALVPLLSAVDGRTDEMIDKWWATVNSIEYTASADDTMAVVGRMMSEIDMGMNLDLLRYEDEAGLFSLNYVAELAPYPGIFGEPPDMPFPYIAFGNSDETVDASLVYEPLPEGGWGIAVIFLPKAMFAEMGVAADAPITAYGDAWMAAELSTDDAAEVGITEVPTTDLITLSNGVEAAQVDVLADTEHNRVVMYEVTDGVIVLSALLTAVDGRTEALEDAWLTTVESITFDGTAEDIMAAMGGE